MSPTHGASVYAAFSADHPLLDFWCTDKPRNRLQLDIMKQIARVQKQENAQAMMMFQASKSTGADAAGSSSLSPLGGNLSGHEDEAKVATAAETRRTTFAESLERYET